MIKRNFIRATLNIFHNNNDKTINHNPCLSLQFMLTSSCSVCPRSALVFGNPCNRIPNPNNGSDLTHLSDPDPRDLAVPLGRRPPRPQDQRSRLLHRRIDRHRPERRVPRPPEAEGLRPAVRG